MATDLTNAQGLERSLRVVIPISKLRLPGLLTQYTFLGNIDIIFSDPNPDPVLYQIFCLSIQALQVSGTKVEVHACELGLKNAFLKAREIIPEEESVLWVEDDILIEDYGQMWRFLELNGIGKRRTINGTELFTDDPYTHLGFVFFLASDFGKFLDNEDIDFNDVGVDRKLIEALDLKPLDINVLHLTNPNVGNSFDYTKLGGNKFWKSNT